MPPSDPSPVLLYSRQQSAQDPSLRIAAVIVPIIIVAALLFALCGCCRCCGCCQKGQPRYPHQQKWWSQTTTATATTTRDHQLGDYDYSREVNRNNNLLANTTTSAGRDTETLPEYSSVPLPPPAYAPMNESRSRPQSRLDSGTQPQMNTHVYAHASGEGGIDIVVGETPTTAAEVPAREAV